MPKSKTLTEPVDPERAKTLAFYGASDAEALALARGFASLTQREAEILPLMAVGTPNRMIAEHLGISVKTLDTHRSNARRKLGVSSDGIPRAFYLLKALGNGGTNGSTQHS